MIFNAIKGNQRNTTYFSINITFNKVKEHVQLPEDVLGEDILDQNSSMQRKWKMLFHRARPSLAK